jgi:hypothetical protein
MFRAGPLPIYRREIFANLPTACENSRISSSIDEMNRPNGYFVTEHVKGNIGLVNTLDVTLIDSEQDTNRCKNACASVNSTANNALRRCRSSGNVSRKINPATNDYAYFTNSNQYLVSRCKTFTQNQYNQVRYADVSLLPNPTNGTDRFYSPNGLTHCAKAYYDGTSPAFYYIWFDTISYPVNIPEGYYDVHDLNAAFELVMLQNAHYFIQLVSVSNAFALKIIYNHYLNAVELQSRSIDSFPVSSYGIPIGVAWGSAIPSHAIPQFAISNPSFETLVGFSAGSYPVSSTSATDIGIASNGPHTIYPSYRVLTYKPSNSRFAQEGGVESSALVARKKYETINTTAATYNSVFGPQVANALSYGVSEQGYTLKSKMGYPYKRTPVISKYMDKLVCTPACP